MSPATVGGKQHLKALTNPGALPFSAAAFLGRMQISMFDPARSC
jgi:hypothetical protein